MKKIFKKNVMVETALFEFKSYLLISYSVSPIQAFISNRDNTTSSE